MFHHPDPAGIINPCLFKIEVLGLGGELLGFNQGSVFPGQGAFADFDVAGGLKKGERVQVHVNVTIPPGGHPVGATAEVFDLKTGGTLYPKSPCAEPEPFVLAMGTVGIVSGQIVRCSPFHHLDPGGIVTPCLFKIALYGIDGKVLGGNSGQIVSGRGVAFDYDLPGQAGLRKDERLQFHGDVWVEHPAEVGSVLEIVDVKTGETRYPVSPCQMPL